MANNKIKEDIDNQAIKWIEEKQKENNAVQDKCKMELFVLCMQYFDNIYDKNDSKFNDNYVIDAIIEAIEKFNIQKSKSFFSYLSFIIDRRRKDSYRKENIYQKNKEKIHKSSQTISLDDKYKTSSSDEVDLYEVIENMDAVKPEEIVIKNEIKESENETISLISLELAQMIIDFQNAKGKKFSEQKKRWYSMFYTEDITWISKSLKIDFFHERDVFNTIRKSYLDFYMEDDCKTLQQIRDSEFKPYNVLVPEAINQENKSIMYIDSEGKMNFDSNVRKNYLIKCENITKGVNPNSISCFHKKYLAYINGKEEPECNDNKLQNNPID